MASHSLNQAPIYSQEAAASSCIPQSTAGTLTPLSVPALSCLSRFVVRFPNNAAYLHAYHDSSGCYLTCDLQNARLFADFPAAKRAANLFSGEVRRVLTDPHRRNVRLALLERNTTLEVASSAVLAGDTGATGAGAGISQKETPAPFIHGSRIPRSEGEALLIDFICQFLDIPQFVGVQSSFGHGPDLLLFSPKKGPSTTLAVPVSVLLLPREEALHIVREKIRLSQQRAG